MVDSLSRTLPQKSTGIGKGMRSVSPMTKGKSTDKSENVSPMKQEEESVVSKVGGNVAVYCRFRPLNEKEIAMGEQ